MPVRGPTVCTSHNVYYVKLRSWDILLHVGEDEILLDDARRYADLLAKSGSAAELHVWQGMVHVFPANLAVLHAAREALDITADFLRRNLAR